MITQEIPAKDEVNIGVPKRNFQYSSESSLLILNEEEKLFTLIKSNPIPFTSEEEESQVSEITITSDGVLSESWTKIENIPSMIITSNDEYVTLDCLTNFELRQYDKRQFETHLIKGKVSIDVGTPILIKIFYKPGEIKFTFSEGKDLVKKDYFQVTEADIIFESLKKSSHRLTKKIHF